MTRSRASPVVPVRLRRRRRFAQATPAETQVVGIPTFSACFGGGASAHFWGVPVLGGPRSFRARSKVPGHGVLCIADPAPVGGDPSRWGGRPKHPC